MEAIKLCRLDTPIIFIEARINLSRFVVTGCAAKTSATVTFPSLKDRKSGSAGMPRPNSYAVFCLKKKNDRVDHPISLYAATKKANELMAHSYSHLYHLPTTGLRFFTIYGPWG